MTMTGLMPVMSLAMALSGGQAATAPEPCGTGNCQPAIERLCVNGACASPSEKEGSTGATDAPAVRACPGGSNCDTTPMFSR